MILVSCLKIFCARICDVTLNTLRTVLFVKGKSFKAFVVAFFEVLIWYYVAREVLVAKENTIFIAVSYALGYATGTFIGSKISKKIKGVVGVQVVVNKNEDKLIDKIKSVNYGISVIPIQDNKNMLLIHLNNKYLKELLDIINNYDDKAFITVLDTKYIYNAVLK